MKSIKESILEELALIKDMKEKIHDEKKSHRLFLQKKLLKAEKSLVKAARDLKQLHMVV